MVYNPALINEVSPLDFELPPRPPVLIRQNAAIYTPLSPPTSIYANTDDNLFFIEKKIE